jgi:hypothetical protein
LRAGRQSLDLLSNNAAVVTPKRKTTSDGFELQVVADIETLGGKAAAIEADAGTPAAMRAAVAKTVETFGGLDIP